MVLSQQSDYERKSKYLDSVVSKSDTIFLVFNKEINFVQSEVPIYEHQIDIHKFKKFERIIFDTLKDGRIVPKNLPGEYDRQIQNYNVVKKIKQPLIFENNYFRNYNQTPIKINKKLIGYEKRTCINDNNRVYERSCGGDSFYKFVFYHSSVKPEFQNKYLESILS